jgi:hypothetical protein
MGIDFMAGWQFVKGNMAKELHLSLCPSLLQAELV